MTKYGVREYIYDELGGFYSPKWSYKVDTMEKADIDFKRLVRDGYYGIWGEMHGIKNGIVRARLELLDDDDRVVDQSYTAGLCRDMHDAVKVFPVKLTEVSRTLYNGFYGDQLYKDVRLIISKMDLVVARVDEIRYGNFLFVETPEWLDRVRIGRVTSLRLDFVCEFTRQWTFGKTKGKWW